MKRNLYGFQCQFVSFVVSWGPLVDLQSSSMSTRKAQVLTSGDNQSMGWTTRDSLQHLLPGTVKVI
eukprot:549569-Amphidinium_carterae.1